MTELTRDDLYFILESLDFTLQRFQDYDRYPSYEFKQERIAEVQSLQKKIRAMRKERK